MPLLRKAAQAKTAPAVSRATRRWPSAALAGAVAFSLVMVPPASATSITRPIEGSPGGYYVDIAASPDGAFVYAAHGDQGEPRISMVETATGHVVSRRTYPSRDDDRLRDLAVSPDGTTLYATSVGHGELLKIDATSLDVIGIVTVPSYVPTGVVISPDGAEAYVSSPTGVTVVDTATMRQVGFIETAGPVYGMAISQTGGHLFLSSHRTREPEASILEVADTRIRSVVSSIDGSTSPPFSVVPVPEYFRESVALSPDESRAYVAINTTVLAYDVRSGTVSVLDSGGYNVFDLAIRPAGDELYVVTDQGLRIVDAATGSAEVVGGLGVRRAGAIAVNPGGHRAYVATGYQGALMEFALNHAPTVSGTPWPGVVGQRYDYTFAVSGEPAASVTVSRGSLPRGLTMTSGGTVTGTPAAAGTYEFTIAATNGIGGDATLDVTLVVGEGELGEPGPAPASGSLGS